VRSVTLKDIARETGYHTSTVSRALDPRTRASLSEQVIQRIRDAAKRMDYRPNRLAAGLRTKRTKTVGVVIPDISNPLFPPIVRGVEKVLEPLGYVSIIVNTDGRRDREQEMVGVLLEHGVDGIIHAAVERDDPILDEVRRAGVPLVTVNRALEDHSVPGVVNDDADGIAMMMEHLVSFGHTEIAHIAGPEQLSTGVIRLAAFRAAAIKYGLDIPEYHISQSTELNEKNGKRCAQALLSLTRPPTAIIAANDRLALGVFDAIQQMGLSCPDDISVTGFNDYGFLKLIPPGLTTVKVDKQAGGRRSAELLMQLIDDPENLTDKHVVLPVEPVFRGSVAAPRSKALHLQKRAGVS
jgi:LacI family transcriptional regulator